jgi:lysophospholipase L1-like esterase
MAINAVIRSLGDELDLPVVDNFSAFARLDGRASYFVKNDEHPNRQGYAVMATMVEKTLIALGHLGSL